MLGKNWSNHVGEGGELGMRLAVYSDRLVNCSYYDSKLVPKISILILSFCTP